MLNRAKLDQLLDRYGSLVWNKWNAPEDAVYIGRGSLYGNPIPLSNPKDEEERIECIDQFLVYLIGRLKSDAIFAGAVMSMKSRDVKCYCSNGNRSTADGARYCHGLILLEAADLLHKHTLDETISILTDLRES